ncbi:MULTISPECIES: DUF485 domain-containing protein [Salinicoccus]|jgi:uncharacterized membrane protein (DUF485 family)|uniref:DUF485 domain-containing protein n=1 Tax=Salinicoccus roseus TaxID=45670 RepID=A0A0C2HKI7_9STAP|nr:MULTISPECIES: DUF485 domain-containing protein [Salinicoccus]KIH70106.1 hypothetical protein SN16_11495 [Salinicoccus roseus]MCC4721555.1 DUF485 domain-containing protein [Salinicoccus sp. RF5]MDB0581429.1 DUF485 domain-containing protein [Salinicoccus roseus]|tara:strand:+ start:57 stop:368 length:312 start_codon:yes stop_codon:yes gene_type:complete
MSNIDYKKISDQPEFEALLRKRNKFILPISIFFIIATLIFPVLTGYTDLLNYEAFGNISWAWIYAIMLFIMVWTLVTIYMKRAKEFDKEADEIIRKYREGEYK